MARTALAVQKIERTGLAPAFTAANAEGHSVLNSGRTFIEVKNAAGAPINVTVHTERTIDGLALTDRVVAVPLTSGDKMIGPFPKDLFDQPGLDVIWVDFSAVTSVTCAAFELP